MKYRFRFKCPSLSAAIVIGLFLGAIANADMLGMIILGCVAGFDCVEIEHQK